SIERRCARGAETEYGKDSYHQGRAKKPHARQPHPAPVLSTFGFRAARSPPGRRTSCFSSRCERVLSSTAGRAILLAGPRRWKPRRLGLFPGHPINQLIPTFKVTQTVGF